jgi:glycerol-3-phosphate O-acyltransferase/dihydroxyacetone phosphate acyltransferase
MKTLKSGERSWTKTQLVVFFIILVLAVDELNPIKLVVRVFPRLPVGTLSCAAMILVFVSDFKELIAYGVTILLKSILSIFFREVEIVGRDNIPRRGPVIFTSTYAYDVCLVLCSDSAFMWRLATAYR